MVVRAPSEQVPKSLMINAALAVGLVATLAFAFRTTFASETLSGCSERYGTVSILHLQDPTGRPFAPIDLSPQFSGDEWGIYSNMEVRSVGSDQVPVAMRVALPDAEGERRSERTSGIGFSWEPSLVTDARVACLSYMVRMPTRFSFEQAGYLPGLRVEASATGDSAAAGIVYRMRWHETGRIGVQVHRDGIEGRPQELVVKDGQPVFKPGKWIRVEQEIKTNSPGQKDGHLRVWVNGEIKLNKEDFVVTVGDREPLIQGVVGDVHYTDRNSEWQAAPKSTAVFLGPLEVRR